MNYKELQEKQFDEIWQRNKKLLGGGKVFIDPYLENVQEDSRLCLTSVFRISDEISSNIEKVLNEFKKININHFYYPKESYHLTLQNIRVISDPPTFNGDDIEKVRKVFLEKVGKHKKFIINVKGLNILPGSVFAQGFIPEEMQDLRDDISEGIRAVGVPDDKKYMDGVGFGNISLIRFKNKKIKDILEIVEKYRNFEFGKLRAGKVELVVCDNCFSKEKVGVMEKYFLKY